MDDVFPQQRDETERALQVLNEGQWISNPKTAVVLGVSRKTTSRWAKGLGCKDFPKPFKVGGQNFLILKEVLAFKAAREARRDGGKL